MPEAPLPPTPEPGAGEEQVWPVPAALEGERLDRVIALVAGVTRKDANEVIDAGRVRIGRRAVTNRSRKVHEGETLVVSGPLGPPAATGLVGAPDVEFGVVHVDDEVIVVDKPAGLVVHPGAGQREGTLVQGLLARFPDLAQLATGDQADRPGIVHRLDKGTSGLLVVARTPEARTDLIAQLAARTMSREYLALVFGDIDSDSGVVDAPLGRSDADPTRIRVQAGGRVARTRYEVLDRFAEPLATTLIRCRLETGRTHQIRVHLASIGHPVVGDDRYGGRPGGRGPDRFPADLPPARPFLHAAGLGFIHPISRHPLHFTSPLPEELLRVLTGISP